MARGFSYFSFADRNGGLPATSINKLREPSADAYLFMTDAATGFATLALADDLKRRR